VTTLPAVVRPPSRPRGGLLVWVALLLAACSGAPARAHSGDWKHYDPSDPAYPQRVDFVVQCFFVKTADDDPIVFPGRPGASHNHTFSGNLAITPSSTAAALLTQRSNCELTADHASYWMPTLYADGRMVKPNVTRAYYRAATHNGRAIKPVPFGLKLVAGDAMAETPQDARIAGFHCRNAGGAVTTKRATPPNCLHGSFLEASVVFANCWDGVHLDAADHRSHMAYANRATLKCDAAHPVQLPQLTVSERFPPGSTAGAKVVLASMHSPLTLHADFFDAWDDQVMRTLVRRCINAGIACEDVSDVRFPPLP
jgi:hypothetical protein